MILLTKFRSSTSILLRPNKVHGIVFDYFCFIFTVLNLSLNQLGKHIKGYPYHEHRKGERSFRNAGNGGTLIFRGMPPNILGNVSKHSAESLQTLTDMYIFIYSHERVFS